MSALFRSSRVLPSPPAAPVEVFDTIREEELAAVRRRIARAAAKDSGHSVQPPEFGTGAILAKAAPE